jgi:hypothetical protein
MNATSANNQAKQHVENLQHSTLAKCFRQIEIASGNGNSSCLCTSMIGEKIAYKAMINSFPFIFYDKYHDHRLSDENKRALEAKGFKVTDEWRSGYEYEYYFNKFDKKHVSHEIATRVSWELKDSRSAFL